MTVYKYKECAERLRWSPISLVGRRQQRMGWRKQDRRRRSALDRMGSFCCGL